MNTNDKQHAKSQTLVEQQIHAELAPYEESLRAAVEAYYNAMDCGLFSHADCRAVIVKQVHQAISRCR